MADETPKVVNKKAQVAETLFNIPTNYMSSGMIKWILSHLPDENKKGEFSASAPVVSVPGPELKFIQSREADLHGAFNLSFEDLTVLKNKITTAFGEEKEPEEGVARVVIMEKVYPQLCDAEKAFLIALGIEPFAPYYHASEMRKNGKTGAGSLEDLIDMLKQLKDKMEKGDEGEE